MYFMSFAAFVLGILFLFDRKERDNIGKILHVGNVLNAFLLSAVVLSYA